jgi:hypothetical protein
MPTSKLLIFFVILVWDQEAGGADRPLGTDVPGRSAAASVIDFAGFGETRDNLSSSLFLAGSMAVYKQRTSKF